jgi:hypothetical protein
MMLMLLTWWARGAADAAQPTGSVALVIAPIPGSAIRARRWVTSPEVHESAAIAVVGSGLIALGAFVRRATGPGPGPD